jgi:hypothetical protein
MKGMPWASLHCRNHRGAVPRGLGWCDGEEKAPSWAHVRISASMTRTRGVIVTVDNHEHRIQSGRSRVLALEQAVARIFSCGEAGEGACLAWACVERDGRRMTRTLRSTIERGGVLGKGLKWTMVEQRGTRDFYRR